MNKIVSLYVYVQSVILGCLLLVIMSSTLSFSKEVSIDPELKWYYNQFMIRLKQHCNEYQYFSPPKISIQFGERKTNDKREIGVCELGKNDFEIVINKTYWDDASPDNRYSLMMHELTHCILQIIRHSPSAYSYMAPEINENLPIKVIQKQMESIMEKVCK